MDTNFLTIKAAARFAGVLRDLGRRPTVKRVNGEWIVGVRA